MVIRSLLSCLVTLQPILLRSILGPDKEYLERIVPGRRMSSDQKCLQKSMIGYDFTTCSYKLIMILVY